MGSDVDDRPISSSHTSASRQASSSASSPRSPWCWYPMPEFLILRLRLDSTAVGHGAEVPACERGVGASVVLPAAAVDDERPPGRIVEVGGQVAKLIEEERACSFAMASSAAKVTSGRRYSDNSGQPSI